MKRKINETELRKIVKDVIDEHYNGAYNGAADELEQIMRLAKSLIGSVNRWEYNYSFGEPNSNKDAIMANIRNFGMSCYSEAKKLFRQLNPKQYAI